MQRYFKYFLQSGYILNLKRIRKREFDANISQSISRELGISSFLSDILVSRNKKTAEDVRNFLQPDFNLSDPYTIKDMDKAVKRIRQSLNDNQKICIYGDYDADGVCSTAILMMYLRDIGANVRYYIPLRCEGYGLNKLAIKKLAEDNVNLIITVDNGIVSFDEVEYINELEMDVIVTDHHQAKENLPNAVAVVNPHRLDCKSEYKELCGAGVVFKLISALEDCDYDVILDNYADIVAVATIGDIVPLTGENRLLVQKGIEQIKMTGNIGLSSLLESLRLSDIDSQDIAFKIVPRLNAAGRLGKAETALKLLLSEDEEEAQILVDTLNEINSKRQQIETQIQEDIILEINQNPSILNDSVLVLAKEGWNHGVIGITASKVVNRFSKPSFLMEIKNGIAVGSGRGVNGVSLFDMLCNADDLLMHYGGHSAAAGLTLNQNNIQALRERFNKYISETCETAPVDEIVVDKVAKAEELTVENIKLTKYMEPFGCENENILYLLKGCKLETIIPLSGGKHTKLSVKHENKVLQILLFGIESDKFPYNINESLDIVVTAEINVYNQRESISLKCRNITLSEFDEETFFKSKFIYEKIMRKEKISKEEKEFVTPCREDMVSVYKFFAKNKNFSFGYDILAQRLGNNYAKIRFIILAMKEKKLLEILKQDGADTQSDVIKLIPNPQKVDLEDANVLKKLRSL